MKKGSKEPQQKTQDPDPTDPTDPENSPNLENKSSKKKKKDKSGKHHGNLPTFNFASFPVDAEFFYEDEYPAKPNKKRYYFMAINFQNSILLPENQVVIGSKFYGSGNDVEAKQQVQRCRIGFYGKFLHEFRDEKELKERLRLYRLKARSGSVDRVTSDTTLIVKNLFQKKTDVSRFIGLGCRLSGFPEFGEGKLIQAFGKSGKVKATFSKSFGGEQEKLKDAEVTIEFKKYIAPY
jgi:hypothetical protein